MKKIKFVLGIHNHQPVGNFKWVFEKAYDVAYKPFIDVMLKHKSIKWNLHSSGMLWEFMLKEHPDYINIIKSMIKAGTLELISGGYYEPLLSVIPSADRAGQIKLLSEFIEDTFGCKPKGAWTAERVWEPSLVKDFANAEIKYTVLDDVHFTASGLKENDLKGYYTTEDEGKVLNVFPISQKLRYFIPFQNVEVCIDYFRQLAAEDKDIVVVMADDGEKFGMWPGTNKHVYENGWLDKFFTALEENTDIVETATFSEVSDTMKPQGRIYLPTNSYFEMSEWTLPVSSQNDFNNFVKQNEFKPEFKPFIRGGFWRNFLTKYEEANNMHKKMLRLSGKLQNKKVKLSSDMKKYLYAGQCNCAYWHGVFGGLYLPHLRNAVYDSLLKCENLYNKKYGPQKKWTNEDFDCDGSDEFLFENKYQNIYVDAENGGSIFEFDILNKNYNLSNVLTRRYEGYHKKLKEAIENNNVTDSQELASIHNDAVRVKELGLENHLFYDWYRKASLLDHFFNKDVKYDELYGVKFKEDGDFVTGKYDAELLRGDRLELKRIGYVWFNDKSIPVEVRKTIKPLKKGGYEAEYRILNLSSVSVDFNFGVEQVFAFSEKNEDDNAELKDRTEWIRKDKNLGLEVKILSSKNCDFWTVPIETVSASENGYEKTYQGTTVVCVYKFGLNSKEAFTFKITTEEISN